MTKKLLALFLALTVVVAFSLSVLAQDIVQGKIEALDQVASKITISGTECLLSVKAPRVKAKVGDQVAATVERNMVRELKMLT